MTVYTASNGMGKWSWVVNNIKGDSSGQFEVFVFQDFSQDVKQ